MKNDKNHLESVNKILNYITIKQDPEKMFD
jgi:hypothetical protein